jgi:hypothetical protein
MLGGWPMACRSNVSCGLRSLQVSARQLEPHVAVHPSQHGIRASRAPLRQAILSPITAGVHSSVYLDPESWVGGRRVSVGWTWAQCRRRRLVRRGGVGILGFDHSSLSVRDGCVRQTQPSPVADKTRRGSAVGSGHRSRVVSPFKVGHQPLLIVGHPPKPLPETLPNSSQAGGGQREIQFDKSPDQEDQITLSTECHKPCQPSVRNPPILL